jgi:Second Messenger Oligonucleotide or Dinucleotide Synthetase domain
MLMRPEDQLEQLLGLTLERLDIPHHLYLEAVDEYQAVGDWLCHRYEGGSHTGCEVYPQGSFRLGTVIRPVHNRDEYDLDLVCRRDLAKESITQAELKEDVGAGLADYEEAAAANASVPTLTEGDRCWTLVYPSDRFHMDVLPAIPDAEGVPNSILLTDRSLRHWQHSNPIDYAGWFHRHMRQEFLELREALAKAQNRDVAEVPEWQVKTTLQRAVQTLKRHRDIHFQGNPKERPASIIITTLAARAYRGGGNLYEVVADIARRMPTLVERRNGVWWVPNPVHAEENFADRWRMHPERARRFFDWMEQVNTDLADLTAGRGFDRVIDKLAVSLGESPVREAAERVGAAMVKDRAAGRLTMASGTGMLGIGAGTRVREHNFHGDPTPRRRP